MASEELVALIFDIVAIVCVTIYTIIFIKLLFRELK